jgi:hypothetical protein
LLLGPKHANALKLSSRSIHTQISYEVVPSGPSKETITPLTELQRADTDRLPYIERTHTRDTRNSIGIREVREDLTTTADFGFCGNTGSHHRIRRRGRVPPLLTCGNTFVNADDTRHGGG